VVVTSRPAAATTTAPPPPPKAGGNRGEEEDGGEVAEEAEEGDDLHIRLLVYSTGQDAEALLRDRLEREAASARAREAKGFEFIVIVFFRFLNKLYRK
jgi:hypothetical protein